MAYSDFILYRNSEEDEYINVASEISRCSFVNEDSKHDEVRKFMNHVLEISEKMGFRGNLWQDYLTYFIVCSQNAFSISCERKGYTEGGINRAAMHDFELFFDMFDTDLKHFDAANGTCLSILEDFDNNNETDKYFNKRIRNRIIELSETLAGAAGPDEFMKIVCRFYGEVGVGSLGMFKAFRLAGDDSSEIVPVVSVEHIYLDDLIGYEMQKKKLTDNTEAFLEGKSANNVLLFGDSGTGKSSSIKAILNEYYDRGLRMIEIYKHQFRQLSAVINQIKDRNYKFIIYMDDLSFEEFEIEYKFLKAVIEGGLEKRPDNVLIYATSNRRHLVREKYSDKEERDDDLHSRDTVQEKLSLSARFGVSIYYGSPDKNEFTQIVKGLAARNNIDIDEQTLLAEANKWELSHGGMSGRTAQQFINYLAYTYKRKDE
ncbi:MAG: ATP-binding protein [Butyrivibrio sp.]